MKFQSNHSIKLVNGSDLGYLEVQVYNREVSEEHPVIIANVDLVSLLALFAQPSGTAVLTSAMEWADLQHFRETGETPLDYTVI